MAKVFIVDKHGRKSCILDHKGLEKSGLVSFLSMINPTVEIEPKLRPPIAGRKDTRKFYSSSSDSDTLRRSYAQVYSDGYPSDSSSGRERSLSTSPTRQIIENENIVIITRRFFHYDWQKIMTSFTFSLFHSDKVIITFKDSS